MFWKRKKRWHLQCCQTPGIGFPTSHPYCIAFLVVETKLWHSQVLLLKININTDKDRTIDLYNILYFKKEKICSRLTSILSSMLLYSYSFVQYWKKNWIYRTTFLSKLVTWIYFDFTIGHETLFSKVEHSHQNLFTRLHSSLVHRPSVGSRWFSIKIVVKCRFMTYANYCYTEK